MSLLWLDNSDLMPEIQKVRCYKLHANYLVLQQFVFVLFHDPGTEPAMKKSFPSLDWSAQSSRALYNEVEHRL